MFVVLALVVVIVVGFFLGAAAARGLVLPASMLRNNVFWSCGTVLLLGRLLTTTELGLDSKGRRLSGCGCCVRSVN